MITRYFKRLFQKFDFNQLVLKKIIANVFSEDLVPKVQMAYVIVVYVIILNLKCEKIKLDKKEMQDRVAFFLVSSCKFVNYDLNCQIVKL